MRHQNKKSIRFHTYRTSTRKWTEDLLCFLHVVSYEGKEQSMICSTTHPFRALKCHIIHLFSQQLASFLSSTKSWHYLLFYWYRPWEAVNHQSSLTSSVLISDHWHRKACSLLTPNCSAETITVKNWPGKKICHRGKYLKCLGVKQ